jgi:hypothetical protein
VLNITIKPKASSDVKILHPGTKAVLCTITLAGPDHEATLAHRREMDDKRQDPDYKPNFQAEIKASLAARIIGWDGVKDENGETVAFDPSMLPDLLAQDWLRGQILDAIGGNERFFID